MQYRSDKNGTRLSSLGYGCMRFTKKGGSIDIDKAEEEILKAVELGVNYFDTAYIYPGSEAALGEIIERNSLRDKIYIATKLPHYLIKSVSGAERMFKEQLSRLRSDYIDYYLMHILSDIETWNKLCSIGIKDWIEQKKSSGQIKNIGFSFHGNTDMFCKIIDAYDWDFCQIQYNYMDENAQAGRRGLEYAASKNIPVVIMEPLRGGRLVELLPKKAKEIIAKTPNSAAYYGLKWLWDQEAVTVVLSGMNSLDMVEENAATADKSLPGSMTAEEKEVVEKIKEEIQKSLKVGCTGCGYCMPCPQGVDIPTAFSCYNKIYADGRAGARKEYLQCTAMRKNRSSASLCIGCGKCETHCPQSIPVRDKLKEASKELEGLRYKAVCTAVKLFKMW